jgi:hypothetical protein
MDHGDVHRGCRGIVRIAFAYPTQSLIGSSILGAATVAFVVMKKSFVTP